MTTRARKRVEFGDFQTPKLLCDQVCSLLFGLGISPVSILEPTCGRGGFLRAALERFPGARLGIGFDIDAEYVEEARTNVRGKTTSQVEVLTGDFFTVPWNEILRRLPDPLLVIGNPPWVTNAVMGSIAGSNLPPKSNFQNYSGLDAITGKSNFDISEWMLLNELDWLDGRRGALAMLCKTSVARKVLMHSWKKSLQLARSEIYPIDALNIFNAGVEACLLVCWFEPGQHDRKCSLQQDLHRTGPARTFGFVDGRLVADLSLYERRKDLAGGSEVYKWRSGIKHDCADIMELKREGALYANGLGERVELEEEYVYPMLKSSGLSNGIREPDRWMLVTQKYVNQDTEIIRGAPKTWSYLQRHRSRFARRASAVYRKRPDFSIFGVGEYSFSPWKVAAPGLYKKLEFKVVAPFEGRPVVFDDTCYFLPCETEREAESLCTMLNSPPAQEFYNALIFWDAKRPITGEILCQLDLHALSREIGIDAQTCVPGAFQPALALRDRD